MSADRLVERPPNAGSVAVFAPCLMRPGYDSNWSRCVLLDQILTLQVRPELSRNLSLHRGVVFQDLMFSTDSDHQGCGYIRCGRKLPCDRPPLDPMLGRNVTQCLAFLNIGDGDLVGVLSVVVPRTARYESGVKRRPDHQRDVLLPYHWENVIERVLVVDQRILRGQKAHVRISHLENSQNRFRSVYTQSPTLDDALFAHASELRECSCHRNLELFLPGSR